MLSRIVIDATRGSLTINTTPARLFCRPGRYEMDYRSNATTAVQIKSTQPRIQIDQTDAFASAGLKPVQRQAMDYYGQSLQKGLNAIGTIAREGMEFLRIEKGGEPIVSQARSAGVRSAELTVRAMPSVPPDIKLLRGHVDIAVGGGLESDWKWIEGESEFTAHSVEIRWQPSTIEITVVPGIELHFPVRSGVGINVDEAI